MKRQMYDKRALRKKLAPCFTDGIAAYQHDFKIRSTTFGAPNFAPPGDQLRVFARKRPLFDTDIAKGEFDVCCANEEGMWVHSCLTKPDLRTPLLANFLAPVAGFSEGASTDQVCEALQLEQLIQVAARGGTAACCMFGQTGSGKTHTMDGVLRHVAELLFPTQQKQQQQQQRQQQQLLFSAQQQQQQGQQQQRQGPRQAGSAPSGGIAADGIQRLGGAAACAAAGSLAHGCVLQLACYEVCGRNGHDLLQRRARLRVREDQHGTIQVSAQRHELHSREDFERVIRSAMRERVTTPTARNADSSRSHAFYHITFLPLQQQQQQQRQQQWQAGVPGSLMLVDLAGSERAADSAQHDAAQQAQSAEINAGLSVLKECFRLRSQHMRAQETGSQGRPAPLLPYRESLLTRVLRDAILPCDAASARIVVVATISPCASDAEATLNTLRHATVMAGADITSDQDLLIDMVELPAATQQQLQQAKVLMAQQQAQAQKVAAQQQERAAAQQQQQQQQQEEAQKLMAQQRQQEQQQQDAAAAQQQQKQKRPVLSQQQEGASAEQQQKRPVSAQQRPCSRDMLRKEPPVKQLQTPPAAQDLKRMPVAQTGEATTAPSTLQEGLRQQLRLPPPPQALLRPSSGKGMHSNQNALLIGQTKEQQQGRSSNGASSTRIGSSRISSVSSDDQIDCTPRHGPGRLTTPPQNPKTTLSLNPKPGSQQRQHSASHTPRTVLDCDRATHTPGRPIQQQTDTAPKQRLPSAFTPRGSTKPSTPAASGFTPRSTTKPSTPAACSSLLESLPTPPARWSGNELATWMAHVSNGRFTEAARQLPSSCDGKALSRMPVLRFKQLCGDERKGQLLFDLWREEVRAASDQRSKAALAVADASRTRRTSR